MAAEKKDIEREHSAFVRWKHTVMGRLAWFVLNIAIAAVFATLAVDSGALWQWALAIFFAGDAVYNLVRLLQKVIQYGRQRS